MPQFVSLDPRYYEGDEILTVQPNHGYFYVATINVDLLKNARKFGKSIAQHPILGKSAAIGCQEAEEHESEPLSRVEIVAQEARCYAGYFPARIGTHQGFKGNHGLACFMRWPFDPREVGIIELPRFEQRNYLLRNVTRRRIAVFVPLYIEGERTVFVIVHLDTRLSFEERKQQFKPIVKKLRPGDKVVILGDMNTVKGDNWKLFHLFPTRFVDQRFEFEAFLKEEGFSLPSFPADAYTKKDGKFGISYKQFLDMICVRNMEIVQAGCGIDYSWNEGDHQAEYALIKQ